MDISGTNGLKLTSQDGAASIQMTETEIIITVGSNTWSFSDAGLIISNGAVVEDYIPE